MCSTVWQAKRYEPSGSCLCHAKERQDSRNRKCTLCCQRLTVCGCMTPPICPPPHAQAGRARRVHPSHMRSLDLQNLCRPLSFDCDFCGALQGTVMDIVEELTTEALYCNEDPEVNNVPCHAMPPFSQSSWGEQHWLANTDLRLHVFLSLPFFLCWRGPSGRTTKDML